MCLVSLVEIEDEMILTSNRDEAPSRASQTLSQENINNKQVWFPSDTAGGSWIFCSDRGDMICLLNGAFERHDRHLPYRMSRGLVMKSFFKYDHPVDFLENFDFQNIEPYTMIIVSAGMNLEFRWDGQIKHIKELEDGKEHVWSSSSLYDEKAKDKREKWFRELRSVNDPINAEKLKIIHQNGGPTDKENGFIMNRMDIVKTISVTQLIKKHNSIFLEHDSLIDGKNITQEIRILK